VYVRSKRAGERVMSRMSRLYAKLKLKVNEEKSTVARVWERKFLGYSFWVAPGKLVKRRVAPKALEGFKDRVREITSRNGGRSAGEGSGRARIVHARMEGVLPPSGHTQGLSRPRPVDCPTAADGATQAVETWNDRLPGDAETGFTRMARPESGAFHEELVEGLRPRRDEHRNADEVPGRIGASKAGTALTSTFRTARCGPHVRWCGRGVDGMTGYPLSRSFQRLELIPDAKLDLVT
jgi:hypothetical protein